MRELLAMFVAIFIAEFGDKTQLATLLFASERKVSPLLVFAASGGALLLSSAIATFLGTVASRYLLEVPFKLIAGIGFIVIGGWTLMQYFQRRAENPVQKYSSRISSAISAGRVSPSISTVTSLTTCRPPDFGVTLISFWRARTRLPTGTIWVKRTLSEP